MHLGLLFLLSALPFFQRHCGQHRLLHLNDMVVADVWGKVVVEVWDKVVVEVVGHGGKRRAREQTENARLDFRQCYNVPSNAIACL